MDPRVKQVESMLDIMEEIIDNRMFDDENKNPLKEDFYKNLRKVRKEINKAKKGK